MTWKVDSMPWKETDMDCLMCGEPCDKGSELCEACSEQTLEYIHPNEGGNDD